MDSSEKLQKRQEELAIALSETLIAHIGEELNSVEAVGVALGWAIGHYVGETKVSPEVLAETAKNLVSAIQEAQSNG